MTRRALSSPHHVRVEPVGGRPGITVDGAPIPAGAYLGPLFSRPGWQWQWVEQAIESGAGILLLPFPLTKFGEKWRPDGALLCDHFDEWAQAIGAHADVWLLPRIQLATPPWWARAHPDELVRYADAPDRAPSPDRPEDGPAEASMASERFLADAEDVLARFVDHVEASPWASRVLGYMVGSGGTSEWVYWGAQEGRIPDYSPPAQRYFREWLHRRHGPADWIEEARIPDEGERRRGAPGLLRDPARDWLAIEYDRALSAVNADALRRFCRCIKERTDGKRIAGGFYGYLLWQTGLTNAVVANGHVALRRLLEDPSVDFVSGITSYDTREPGAPGPFMLPGESVQAAGKLHFNECDVRTHLTAGDPWQRYHHHGGGLRNLWPLGSARESVDVLRREFIHHVIHGAGWWYFDMQGGWYDSDEIQQEMRAQRAIHRKVLAWDKRSVAEVAAVVSEFAPAFHALHRMQDVQGDPDWAALQCDRATEALYRTGAPVDWWEADDLARVEGAAWRRYRLLYLFNPTALAAPQREAIERLKGDRRTLVFIGHPDLCADGEPLDPERASTTAGIRLELASDRQPAELQWCDYEAPCAARLRARPSVGSAALIAPRLIPTDPEARVLARWPNGEPAAATRDHGSWRAYFFPVPPNHARLLQGLVDEAGCHRYVDEPDVVYANRSLLGVHFGGPVQPVRLPAPSDALDLFGDARIAEAARRIHPDPRRGASQLFAIAAAGS